MYIPLTFEGALQKCLFASSSTQGTFVSGGIQYAYHRITGSSNFEVYQGSLQAQLVVVGGGGGGGTAFTRATGGGGGGQVKYFPSQQFYAGTYNITIGGGGDSPAGTGGNTFITGPGVSVAAIGGIGANGTTGGTSGDGFAGGTGCTNFEPNGGVGGGGGGSRGAAEDENCSSPQPADGGAGFNISIANYDWSFGCGGGGGASVTAWDGASCFGGDGYGGVDGTPGGPNTGNGGGGGASEFYTINGGAGGSGIVIIQYPINDYCKNFYNETGSCGCRQLTFDITDELGYYPDVTGSYIYMPCGESQFASGSLSAYSPKTVCAVSNSYFSVSSNSGYGAGAGFANSGPECISASLAPTTCSVESFVPTCTSKIVTIYTPSASVGTPNSFGYVSPNATEHSTYDSTSARVKYICISTGSLYANNQRYPQVLTGGNASIINSASCNTVTFTSTVPPGFNRQGKYYDCNGNYQTFSGNGPFSITACIDTNTFFGFVGPGTTGSTSVTIGGDCLTGSNLPYCFCQDVYNIQNCFSASVTASITTPVGVSLQTGSTITSNISGLSGSCWSVVNSFIPTSSAFTPTYSNVVIASTYSNCEPCISPIVGKYNIIDCNTSTNYVSTFSSVPTLGTVFKSNDLNKCFTIASLASASVTADYSNLSIVQTYADCATCLATSGSLLISSLVVGGGGAGGGYYGGGGGAGEYEAPSNVSISLATTYPVVVGAGGIAAANKGTDGGSSSFNGVVSIGGGAGGALGSVAGNSGSSGGGGSFVTSGAGGTGTAGFNGGPGSASAQDSGGGGGSSAAGIGGSTTSNGGNGTLWIDGNYYAGGGGGFRIEASLSSNGIGGLGGGGNGGQTDGANRLRLSSSGSANTGGGGGGSIQGGTSDGTWDGGSGVVKIRYAASSSVATGGTVSISGSYVYHTFTGSGNFII